MNINSEALHINEWLKFMENKYLTIGDIINTKPDETIKLLCLDRNLGDLIDHNEKNKPTIPSIFFQKCYIINYIHKEELKGEIQWLTCDFSKEKEPFNFHINYSSGFWYPLDDYGMLPHVDPQGFVKFDENTNRNWKKYSENTLIGWRGPMLRWIDVENSPLVML